MCPDTRCKGTAGVGIHVIQCNVTSNTSRHEGATHCGVAVPTHSMGSMAVPKLAQLHILNVSHTILPLIHLLHSGSKSPHLSEAITQSFLQVHKELQRTRLKRNMREQRQLKIAKPANGWRRALLFMVSFAFFMGCYEFSKRYLSLSSAQLDGAQTPVTAQASPASSAEEQRANAACAGSTQQILDEAYGRATPPQLTKNQAKWISDEVHTAGRTAGAGINYLVFGLGFDSPMWRKLNCAGRTVFLESDQAWIQQTLAQEPGLEVYLAKYNTTVSKADEYFNSSYHWSLDVPANVSGECFEVILVDAPPGFELHQPGRLQSARLAVQLARRCIVSGQLQRVVIFAHDLNRPLEQRIVKEMFLSDPWAFPLGTMDGNWGRLGAWEWSKNVRVRP